MSTHEATALIYVVIEICNDSSTYNWLDFAITLNFSLLIQFVLQFIFVNLEFNLTSSKKSHGFRSHDLAILGYRIWR